MGFKRKYDVPERNAERSYLLSVKPIGGGQEVGRSCIILEYMGKKIMLDCGIHPGLSGWNSLPFFDETTVSEIDLLLITHFHLDHCGALPWFLQKTAFKGRCFMTHATKAIYRWLLSDYIKVSNIATDEMLYTEADLEESMKKIEVINFHEEKEIDGVRFWAYNAGHVLGAAMFMIEIAGVKVLYTGDFSRQEDRHLMAAEIPTERPDILITESTYGTHVHEKRELREDRFTGLVHKVVKRGGRCLIPVFALGRAQELLLILDEFWARHSELHPIPIFFASNLGQKSMAVYQTFTESMNEKVRQEVANNRNPFAFKHISIVQSANKLADVGPCVILASPGMMQSGLSRELFEAWCTDAKNGVIIAGYSVEGTLAKHILSEPDHITTMAGQKLPLNMSVSSISFAAHTDYQQTSDFIRILKPRHVVLVHGQAHEMSRLKSALVREFQRKSGDNIQIHNPGNNEAAQFRFEFEATASLKGSLAYEKPIEGQVISGVLIKRNFKYQIIALSDVPKITEMNVSSVNQKMGIHYSGNAGALQALLSQVSTDLVPLKIDKNKHAFRLFNAINVTLEKNLVNLEWQADAVNDMFADAVVSAVLKFESLKTRAPFPMAPVKFCLNQFNECLIKLLKNMFGDDAVFSTFERNTIVVTVDDKKALIDRVSLQVECTEDSTFRNSIQTAVLKLYQSLVPV